MNENVGSLVNTLTLYQHTDLRLEAFARQLSEEWDVSIFLDFLIAQNLCLQVRFLAKLPRMCMPCNACAKCLQQSTLLLGFVKRPRCG